VLLGGCAFGHGRPTMDDCKRLKRHDLQICVRSLIHRAEGSAWQPWSNAPTLPSTLYPGPGPLFSPLFSDFVNNARIHPFQAFPWEVSAVSVVFSRDLLNSLPSHAFQASARDVAAVLEAVDSRADLIESPSPLLNSLPSHSFQALCLRCLHSDYGSCGK
jgi:hypothetical protein